MQDVKREHSFEGAIFTLSRGLACCFISEIIQFELCWTIYDISSSMLFYKYTSTE